MARAGKVSTSNNLYTITYHGLPLGINQNVPPQEIPDGGARWIQDALLDNPGEVRKRGPVSPIVGVTYPISGPPQGMFQTIANDGTFRWGLFVKDAGTGAPTIYLEDSGGVTGAAAPWGSNTWTNPPVYQAKPGLAGGTMLGTAPSPIPTANANLAFWGGSTKATYTTGTLTSSQGNQVITGSGTSWLANVDPGAFVFKGSAGSLTYIGQVATVDSDTQITLRQGAWNGSGGVAYSIQPYRGVSVRVGKGRITVSSGQTTVIGAGTKFGMMTDIGDTWHLYRASDMSKIGLVSSITNDRALELDVSGAAFDVSNEQFVAVRETPSNSFSTAQTKPADGLGFLTTVYQGRQFYANLPLTSAKNVPEGVNMSTRVWWSELFDPEAVDMSATDGDFFHVTSQNTADTPIMAIVGLQNAMAILKENELFALYGTDPSTFTLRKIADVGTVSAMSVVQYRNTVIFAGRNGIYTFDGVKVTALSDTWGNAYLNAMTGFDSTQDRAYGAIFRDHYLLSLTKFNLDYQPTRGAQGTTISNGTLVMNLMSGAWSFFTNVQFVGWANLPPSSGYDSWFVVQNTSNNPKVCDAHTLWTGTGKDTVTCNGQTAGPNLYIETKRYDMGDAERMKLLKQVQMHYKLSGDTLSMDTVPGMAETGYTSSVPWNITSDFVNARVKFLKRDTHIGFRLYETNSGVTDAVLGPFAIAFKLQRVGRV